MSLLAGIISDIFTSKAQGDAQSASARTIQKSQDKAIAEMQRQFDVSMGLTQPRRDAENAALNQLLGILGIGDQQVNMNALQIPGQDFAINEGSRAIERSAAARGGLMSGNTLAALQDRAQGVASQNFLSHYLNPLVSLGLGQANAAAGAGAQNLGTNIANTVSQAGMARANIYGQPSTLARDLNQTVQGGLSNFLTAFMAGG